MVNDNLDAPKNIAIIFNVSFCDKHFPLPFVLIPIMLLLYFPFSFYSLSELINKFIITTQWMEM